MSQAGPEVMEGGEQMDLSSQEQREPLLRTKLFVPLLQPKRVNRPRLTGRISSGLDKALILVSAPAGYGKTTLVSSWLHETKIPSAWISLDEGDNDPIHFLQYFLTALQKIIPAIQLDMLSALGGSQPNPFEALLNIIINEIARCPTPFVLVLDDFHIIHAQPILDMLTFLLEHMPPQMHVVILSRTDPLLPLSHLRVRNQLVEIRADRLRFTREEIAVFLNEVMALELSADDITAMQARTEGWIAGLQLAALSLQGREDIHSFVTAFAGSHYYIIDYLTEEVLKRQTEGVRSFLLQTSILRRMCGPLCEAVVEADDKERVDGQSMLEDLERMNLFLIPLDDVRRWYRYHHLFADMLNRHMENLFPHLPTELHRRAYRWHEQNGYIPEAIHHALMAGDQDRATQLIEQNGVLLLIRGEVTTLLGWIESVEPHSQSHPWLYIFKAWAFALSGYPDQVEGMLSTAEGLIASLEMTQGVRVMQGAIAAARAHRANLLGEAHMAADFARQALEYLPDIDLVSRSLRTVATALIGDACSISGNLEEARQAYMESARIGQAAGDVHLIIVANSNLANVLIEQGMLRQAARIYSETLLKATRPDGQKSIIAGRVLAELSQVYYEWNHLEDAFQFTRQSLALCRQWGNMDLQAVGYVMLARLEHLQRHPEKAQEAMQAAEQIANEYNLAPRYSFWVESALARLSIVQGNLEKASRLIQESGITTDSIVDDVEIPYLREPIYLIWLHLLLAHGAYDTALALSERLLQKAQTANRQGRVLEVLVLQALVFQGKRDLARALAILERALSLAQPEGYVRVFLDEGEPMAKLLYQAKSHRIGQGYTSELLSALGRVTNTEQPATQLLIEPLTQRELELLKLIEEGCTNQDIAVRLVISIPTVKRHISNIYSKLGAKSRTQAISLGRELKLFD
jgi:ATP/maltotriose-dependent transcriptional regulator MalT